RALLYAVYDFLETSLGYRWYFPYPEDNITPSLSPAAFDRLLQTVEDRETEPAFSFRSREFRDVAPTTDKTDGLIVHQIDWWAKLRMNRFLLNFNYASNTELWARWQTRILPEIKRRGMLVGLGEHGSYPLFLPPHRYANDHPEWYCEIDGKRIGAMHTESGDWAQFCTTNPEAVATYLENFAAFVREHPEVDFYYPAPNDIGLWCECATCRDIPVPDRYMQLNNQVAEKLNAVKPGTRIMHLAYSNHSLPPENTQPHPMIDVDVAVWGRDFSYPLCDPRTMPEDPEYLDLFRNWAALCSGNNNGESARLLYHWKIMRHYWLGLHLTPLPVIDEDFNCIRKVGINGFDLPLAYLGIWTKALNAYVVANKTWNPDLSAAALTRRFMADYYGEHADTAQRAYELVAEAFRDKRYGRSLTLAWFPDTSKVRAEPLEGLGDNARHAADRLDEALALVKSLQNAPPPLDSRFQKLHTVIRHARDEQRVLVALDALMQECHAYQQEESEAMRMRALESWDKAKIAADHLASVYSLREDEAGLYWDGASHKQLHDALARWRLLLEAADWHKIGEWETEHFNNSTAPITRRFDVTDALQDKLPGLVQLRFEYTGGELGASLRGAALLQQDHAGNETTLAEDRHGGFVGYIHENAVYRLNVETAPPPAPRYILEVELAAYATSGSVAERGCNGAIFLGLPKKVDHSIATIRLASLSDMSDVSDMSDGDIMKHVVRDESKAAGEKKHEEHFAMGILCFIRRSLCSSSCGCYFGGRL
ncbi:MAG TPA: DUF4838 domain-containing protein, partial [Candidatus Hydrogenedentes bacterium]|nr:DUF4838 domain-containing protein [Candidatus Hydrogenedentota bacterium]